MALGGAGVADGERRGSALNPAVSAGERGRHATSIQGGLRVRDPDSLIRRVEDFQDSGVVERTRASAEDARDTFQGLDLEEALSRMDELRDSLDELAANTDDLRQGLELLDERPALAEGGGGLVVPAGEHGEVGVTVVVGSAGWGRAEAEFRDAFLYDALDDLEVLQDLLDRETFDQDGLPGLIDELEEREWTALEIDWEERSMEPQLNTDDLDSEVRVRGMAVTEVGVGLGRWFDVGGQRIAIGATPKAQQIYTFDYREVAHRADQWDFYESPYREPHTRANLDLGAIAELGEHWHLGATLRNAVPHDLDTAEGKAMHLRPQTRVGAGLTVQEVRLDVDADLNEVDPLDDGYGAQFAGLGLRLPAGARTELRFGYRRDLAHGDRHVGSVGLGRVVLDRFRVDLAVAANRHELGATLAVGW